jgi:hypothetical protein
MVNEISKELWELEDEYIDRRISGEDIDIDDYCNKAALDEKERAELRDRLLGYEASQKGLERYAKIRIDSNKMWDKISQSIMQKKKIPFKVSEDPRFKGNVLRLAAEDPEYAKEFESRLMDEFDERIFRFSLYKGQFLYRNLQTASLVFRKGAIITTDLDGFIVDLWVDGHEKKSYQIKNGSIIVNFNELGISISDYANIRYRIRKDNELIDEGSLGDE